MPIPKKLNPLSIRIASKFSTLKELCISKHQMAKPFWLVIENHGFGVNDDDKLTSIVLMIQPRVVLTT